MNEEAKGRGGSKVISNPFAGIAPLPVAVPPDPLSGLMAMEAEEIAAAAAESKDHICGQLKAKVVFEIDLSVYVSLSSDPS